MISGQVARLPALVLLLAGILLCDASAVAGGANAAAKSKVRPCAGPAVELDPERFACAANRSRDPRDLPLPRGVEKPLQDDSGIGLADGVSLEGRLGPRDAPQGAMGSLDSLAPKRTAIVPRDQEPGLGKTLRHGTSDGVGLGFSIDFDSH